MFKLRALRYNTKHLKIPKLKSSHKVILILITYFIGYGYTHSYVSNNYWCDNDSSTYSFESCRSSVDTKAFVIAFFFWPVYGVYRIGDYFAPKRDIYRKDSFTVGPKPGLEETKQENK